MLSNLIDLVARVSHEASTEGYEQAIRIWTYAHL